MSAALIVLGEFATTFFSGLMGLIGASKLLQAIARDDLIPGVSFFARGTPKDR
ncbi:cation chloride cotransporter 6 [Coccidioides immitis RMSCC 3703]|uniref:Cation chloride cotransporter 6 n=1 Tax=Coccidioides immitis RMSCC 3703 TaxID=454286 RepID=A0A0J8QUJ3_COCIT|nr:cation chloride cotransporter 6 [Coccidioides immitis RMSCC 3703]